MTAETWVAGVDGCRGGWLVALRPLASPRDTTLRLLPTFAAVLALAEAPSIIAVDMPIGLPDSVGPGGRGPDRLARTHLGARQSSVFAVPSRSAVMTVDYRAACAMALETSDPPRKISKQAFNLFPKIREIDALITPDLQIRVVECHPELAFWRLNGERPLREPKKLKSRAHDAGLAERRALLAMAGYTREILDARPFRAADAGADDCLDALVNSWAAVGIANGTGRRFPDAPERDARGLRIEIWAG